MGTPTRRGCSAYPWTFIGTTKIKNLDQNLGALAAKLSEKDLGEISEAVPIDDVAGGRYYNGTDHISWKFTDTVTHLQKIRGPKLETLEIAFSWRMHSFMN